jgi:signal transduction histidine kinase
VDLSTLVWRMNFSRFLEQTANSSSPLRLLLVLELAILGLGASIQVLVAIANHNIGVPSLNLLGIVVFAGMRSIFPHRWIHKLLYTAAEFGVLLLLTFLGDLPSPSLLYLVLTMRNCVLLAGEDKLERKVRGSVTFLAFILCWLTQTYRLWAGQTLLLVSPSQISSVSLGFTILFALVFLFLHLLVDALIGAQKGQEQLTEANSRLRDYALRVEELATLQERNRIARDIHDSLGHSLTVFNIHTEAARRLLHTNLPEAEALLLELKNLGAQALQEVRESVTLLRADPLQGRSLYDAIASLVSEFHRTTGTLPTFTYEIPSPLAVELNFTLYRLVQESLTNIRKHAAASEVAISIDQTGTEIQVSVRDNGKGFDLQHNPSGFGLQGMEERSLALGGNLKITTAPDRGCQMQVVFPVRSR